MFPLYIPHSQPSTFSRPVQIREPNSAILFLPFPLIFPIGQSLYRGCQHLPQIPYLKILIVQGKVDLYTEIETMIVSVPYTTSFPIQICM